MKLNPDCMRDILFYLEEHLSISEELEFEEISMYALAQHLDYPIQELANTLVILTEAGILSLSVMIMMTVLQILMSIGYVRRLSVY